MAVRRHGNEIDVLLRCDTDELVRRISHRQPRRHRQTLRRQLRLEGLGEDQAFQREVLDQDDRLVIPEPRADS